MLDTRLQSSSCQDLSNNNLHSSSSFFSHNNNNNHILAADAHERERLKAMLPTYRPAPDYETAVQLKYRTPPNELYNLNQLQYQAAALAAHNSAAAYYAGSQPDVHQTGESLLLGHMATHRYPDVAQPAQAMHAQYNLSAATAAASGLGSAVQNNVYVDLPQRLQMIRTKPPPPYPVNRLSSSSTPDLAVASHRPLLGYRAYVSGSSPDLVSNRNLINSQYPYNGHPGGLGNPGQITTSSGATMLHQYPYMGHMGHSQSYLPPHGTFENLNMIEEQPSIMSQLRQSALSQAAASHVSNNTQSYEQNSPTLPPSGYRTSTTQPAALQRNAMNGSIEPIYENVPLPQYTSSSTVTPQRNNEQRSSGSSTHNTEIRNRTSSIQSAPGGMHNQPPVPAARHLHHMQQKESSQPQQLTQQQIQQYLQAQDEPDEISMNIKKFNHQTQPDRAASTDVHLLEPTPPQRTVRAASAAPAIGQSSTQDLTPVKMTPPPRQHKMKNSSSVSTVDVMEPSPTTSPTTPSPSNVAMNSTRIASSQSHDDSLSHHFSAMNLSSTSSSIFNNSLENTAQSSSTANNTSSKEKRKKRWNFLGRSKTPDKQKSATLGREKAANTTKLQKIKLAQDDLNLHHRWSTGVPKLQPISGQYSKDKLVRK